MSFSPKQQGVFRPLVEEAWQNMCRHEGIDPAIRCGKSKKCGQCAYCLWYVAELKECTGVESTADVDKKRGFETVMAHFAQIAENIYWMRQVDGGDVRRLLHNVQQICKARDFDQHYIEGVAVKALKLGAFPGWDRLSYNQVGTILSALKSKARHYRDCATPSAALIPTPVAADPDWTV